MIRQRQILESTRRLAFYGLRRSGQGFANTVLDDWRQHTPDLEVIAVRPDGEALAGLQTVRSAADIEPSPDAAVVVLSSDHAHAAVDDVARAGLRHLWLVLNAASRENVALANELGLEVAGGCPLLFMPHTGFPHNLHRGLARLFGRL